MKKKGLIIAFICLIFSIGATAGLVTLQNQVSHETGISSPIPMAVDVPSLINDGKSLLQAHNILAARDKFSQAVNLDHNNQEANLLYGVTRVFAVMEDGQTLNTNGLDSVREILQLAGASIQSFNIYSSNMTIPKKFAVTTPRTGAVLDFLKTKAMPEIEGAIANLAMVTDTAFTSVLPAAGLGKIGADITVDYADALVIKALLNAAKCDLNLLMVYGLDVSLPDIQANPKQLMTYKHLFQDTGFLAIKDASSLTTAKSALIAFINDYNAAVPILLARHGGAHHLFVVDLPVTDEPFPVESQRLNKIKGILNEIQLSLAGSHTFTGTAPVRNRTIDLSKFFDAANPIDIRAKLADPNNILPDPTLNGLFPQGLTGYDSFATTYKPDILGVIFNGQETPYISVKPDFLYLNGNNNTQYLTIRNRGTADLHVSSINLGGSNAQDIALNSVNCGAAPTLAPNNSCTVSLALKPAAAAGNKSAILQIASDDISSMVTSVNIGGFQPPPATISFTGSVTESTGTNPIPGATVEMAGNPGVSTTSGANGGFTLTGLPSGTDFSMKISKAGYLPVYTSTINYSNDIMDPIPQKLFTETEVRGWGVASGKGVIAALAVDATNFASSQSGAVVTASSANHPLNPYSVTYFDGSNFGGNSTFPNGLVFVMNVDDGDIVTLHMTKNGWKFSDAILPVHGDAVSEALLLGASGISFSGNVTDSDGTPISGAKIEMVGNPSKWTTSDAGGVFSLTGLPSGTIFTLEISKDGFLPVYTPYVNTTSDITLPTSVVLYTPGQAAGWGPPVKGFIAAKIMVEDNPPTAMLSCAVVTAVSANHPDTPYPVTYFDGASNWRDTCTYPNGVAFALNVDDGDTVTLKIVSHDSSYDPVMLIHGDAEGGAILYGKLRASSGDINGDGDVTIGDALLALRVAVGLVPMDNKYLANGDVAPFVNGKPAPDGEITIADALIILRKSVGLINW